jgi:hypothetical protein
VADFLSDEWIAALADSCRDTTDHLEPGPAVDRTKLLVVEPVVVDVPGRGEVRYRISFDATSCTDVSAVGDAPVADVRIETDYATAVVLARGETNAQAALADGRLRVTGDVVRLAAHASALARLDDLFATVRAATTYPEPLVRGHHGPS